MNKRNWIIPILIVAINALAVLVSWNSMQEVIPAHFDLEGNADGSMQRSMLLVYPLIGAAICLLAYVIARMKQKLQMPLVILVSGVSLILFLSTLVALTAGKVPAFMLAEPVVLLATVAAVVVCLVKSRKNTR